MESGTARGAGAYADTSDVACGLSPVEAPVPFDKLRAYITHGRNRPGRLGRCRDNEYAVAAVEER